MCLHLLLGPASSSRIFRVFYQQNSLPALSIVKNVSHARKTDFSHEKPVALWILADHCRGGGVWTNELGILPVFWASHPVFLSIQQRMGAKGGSGPSARSGVARLRESFELSMWNCPNLFINIYRNVLFVNFYQKTKCFKSAARDFGGDKTVTGHCKNVFCVRYCISSISLEMCQKIAH